MFRMPVWTKWKNAAYGGHIGITYTGTIPAPALHFKLLDNAIPGREVTKPTYLNKILAASGFSTSRDCRIQGLETKSKIFDHAFRPRLPVTPSGHAFRPRHLATSSDHAFRPRLPTTPSDHAFEPRLPSCCSITSDDSSHKTKHGETLDQMLHCYVTTLPNVTAMVRCVLVELKLGLCYRSGCYASYPLENDC